MSDFSDLMREAKLARAYINITKKMGPSEQLLAFVDYDNKLSDVTGLESFGWSSLEDRHQMLLNTLDPSELESIAIESFLENLLDAIVEIKKEQVVFRAISLSDYKGKNVKYNYKNVKVNLYSRFKYDVNTCEDIIYILSKAYSKYTPRSDSRADWEKCYDLISDENSSFDRDIRQRYIDIVNKYNKLNNTYKSMNSISTKGNGFDYKKSGWSATIFKSSIDEYFAIYDDYKKQSDNDIALYNRLVIIANRAKQSDQDKQTLQYADVLYRETKPMLNGLNKILNSIRLELAKVAHLYKVVY